MNTNTETEVRFLEIDVPSFKSKLKSLGAKDLGEDFFRELIFYDRDLKWQQPSLEYGQRVVRLRNTKKGILLSYKHKTTSSDIHATEIQIQVNNWDQTIKFLEAVGLVAYRHQEKKRHSFSLDGIYIDIDTWPNVPSYVELEGPSIENLQELALKLGLDWSKVVTLGAGSLVKTYYNIPVMDLRYFTFDKIE